MYRKKHLKWITTMMKMIINKTKTINSSVVHSYARCMTYMHGQAHVSKLNDIIFESGKAPYSSRDGFKIDRG